MPYHLITDKAAKMPGDYKPQGVVAVPRRSKTLIVIRMPLPPKELSPNARVHWARKAKVVKAVREEAYYSTLAAMREVGITAYWPIAVIEPRFYVATNRRRDRDNLAASLKAARDGIADAGLVANDTDLRNIDPEIIVDKTTAPRVELWIKRKEIERCVHGKM